MNINIRYGIDSISKSFPNGVRISDLLTNPDLRAVLGYGDNVRALVSGVEQPNDATVADGATVVIETKTNTKNAPDVQVTVRYGIDSVTRTMPGPLTVGDIKEDEDLRALLGYGDNVRCLVSGVEQPDDAGLHHGAVVVIETKTNTKNR
jgi:hypothetical protein